MIPSANRMWMPGISLLVFLVLSGNWCLAGPASTQPVHHTTDKARITADGPHTLPTEVPSREPRPLDQIKRMREIIKHQKENTSVTSPAPEQKPSPAVPVAREATEGNLPTTLPAGERTWFSFADMPYSDVLNYIERISGLPIIGDREIAGTVTYFSRKKMTLDEAIQELNLLLRTKDRVLRI